MSFSLPSLTQGWGVHDLPMYNTFECYVGAPLMPGDVTRIVYAKENYMTNFYVG
jgi:hypothetical protein